VEVPRDWFAVGNPRHRPTVAHLWDQAKIPFSGTVRAYVQYANELDTLRPSMVSPMHFVIVYYVCNITVLTYALNAFIFQVNWEPYKDIEVLQLGVSTMCSADEDLYMMRCPLICFYAVEHHLPHRVARQFGLS
jgi:hypothetical protein